MNAVETVDWGEPDELLWSCAEIAEAGPGSSVEDRVAHLLALLVLATEEGAEESGAEPVLEEAAAATRWFAENRHGSEVALWLWELGNAFLRVGRLEAAERVVQVGLDERTLPVESSLLRRTNLLHLAARLARLRGQWSRAEACLEEMAAVLEREDVRAQLLRVPGLEPLHAERRAQVAIGRATTLYELGILDRARKQLDEARRAAEESRFANALAAVALLGIDNELMLQQADRGLALVQDAREAPWFAVLPPDLRASFDLAEGLARTELERDALETGAEPGLGTAMAVAALERSLAPGALQPPERLTSLLALADVSLLLDDRSRAAGALERARRLVDDLADDGDRLQRGLLCAALEWELAVRSGAAAEQINAEADVAAESDERTSRERLLEDLESGYDELLARWSETELRPGGIGFLHVSWRRTVLGALIDARLRSARSRDVGARHALEVLLRAQAMGTLARSEGAHPGTWEELASELLGPKRGLLCYLPARARSYLFVADSKGVEAFVLSSRSDVRRRLRPLLLASLRREALSGSDGLDARDALLPAEVRQRIEGWRELYVHGMSLLDALPIEDLPWDADQTLGQRFAVAGLPSTAWALGRCRTTASAPPPALGEEEEEPDVVLVVAPRPADTSARKEPLIYGRDEQARLLGAFAGRRVLPLEGRDASVERLRQVGAAWEGVPLVVFLSHGTYSYDRERGAALLLDGPRTGEGLGRYHAEDVERDLCLGGSVVLLACRTGRGPLRLGDDEPTHLGAAFLTAGARSVVLTTTDLRYEEALALFEVVGGRLAAGAAPAEALRLARTHSNDTVRRGAGALRVLGLGFEPLFPE